ncbi:hypothetical protein [Fodinicola feengrottensis]|nr:hypothetical protein [Fodinicola feengrottensis]
MEVSWQVDEMRRQLREHRSGWTDEDESCRWIGSPLMLIASLVL